jgi:thioredoxin reductase (NADPH)
VFDPITFETNVRGLYVAGAVVAGVHSGKIFIENGRFHGQQVIEAIAARRAAGASRLLIANPELTGNKPH